MNRSVVAEVVERARGRLARVGYREGDGVLVELTGADAVPSGSFIDVEIDDAQTIARARTTADGAPIIAALPDTALAAVHQIAARAELRAATTPAIATETAAILATPAIDDDQLLDLTHLPFITIDYERSRDLDQALYVCRSEVGFNVFYALADAAFYIRPQMALFDEALARGTSYYLPGLTIPMLPPALSEGLVSLNASVDRRAFVFRMAFDKAGVITDSNLVRARIRSRAKLTYDGVQAHVDHPTGSALAGHDYSESLDLLAVIGHLRIAEASRRDVIRYDRVAVRLGLAGPEATRLSVHRDERNDVQKWNEQISLVTNMEGASFLAASTDAGSGLAGLFRVHPGPGEDELASFATSIEHLVETLGLSSDWCWRRGEETMAAFIERLPDDGPGWRLARALQRQAMIMGRPSTYATDAAPHYGVGADAYSRFSSPMREIVGIVTMHIAIAQLRGQPLSTTGLTPSLIEQAVAAGNRANRAQKTLTRSVNKMAIDELFGDELELPPTERPIRSGTVMGVTAEKIYVQLDDPPIEVKLYVVDQEKQLGSALSLRNRFELATDPEGGATIRVGGQINVRVTEYTEGRERWVLRIERGETGGAV